MKKIIYGGIIVLAFILGLYFVQIKVSIEQNLNSVRVCNNTLYDIDYFERRWWKAPYRFIHYSDIQSGTCTDFKPSYRLDNKSITMIRTTEDEIVYVYENNPEDPNSYIKNKLGKYTLYINELVKSPRDVRSGGRAGFKLIRE